MNLLWNKRFNPKPNKQFIYHKRYTGLMTSIIIYSICDPINTPHNATIRLPIGDQTFHVKNYVYIKMSTFIHCIHVKYKLHILIPVNPPPFRGSLPRKSLISRLDWVSCAGDINLPHTPFPPARPPPNIKIKYNKILTYILRSIFLEIPHLELPR